MSRIEKGILKGLGQALAFERGQRTLQHQGVVYPAGSALDVIRRLTDGVDAPRPADPRILLALDYLRDNLRGAVALQQVTAVVNLWPSRFRHLVVHEMGLAFRP